MDCVLWLCVACVVVQAVVPLQRERFPAFGCIIPLTLQTEIRTRQPFVNNVFPAFFIPTHRLYCGRFFGQIQAPAKGESGCITEKAVSNSAGVR
jgi:hypothetical protein